MPIIVGKKNIVQKSISLNKLSDRAEYKRSAREDANWKDISDVDYEDLEHFIGNCRRLKDAKSFDAVMRIITAIRHQVLENRDVKNKTF